MLKYALRENLLTPEPEDYMAQTVAAGTCHVEVRTKFVSSSKSSKTLKVGRFSKELTVAAAT